MRRADIEVPNLPVAVDAWGRSACYPQGNFYAANDCMANGVMMALRDKGLGVPDDVSVIGFDDELYKTIPNSILTSVKFRHRELGIRALNEVVAGLEAPSSRSRTLVSGVLVERSSVRDLRA